MGIVHQKQPTMNTCVSTCLAMVLGRPVDEVIAEFHGRYYNNWEVTISEYLIEKGVEHRTKRTAGRDTITFGRLYLATVPSLNIPGSLHQIVIDLRDSKFIVYDPIQGWPGKKFYVGADQDPEQEGAFIIHSWSIDVEFP